MPPAAPRTTVRSPAPRAATAPLLVPIGLVLVAGLFVFLAWSYAPHTVDDAWITFRYSRQWALGHGPYFNPGEHVEGYSNLLLMLLMTPVIALAGAGAALPVAKAIGLASGVLAVIGAGVLARRAAGSAAWGGGAAIAAAGLVACVPGFAYHTMSGLETALFACLLVWGAIGLAAGTGRGILLGGLALAAAAITRPEGPAMFALAWLAVAVRLLVRRAKAPPADAGTDAAPGWRPLLVVAIAGAIVILGQVAFRHAAYDGEWVPNTYFAKIGGSGDRVSYITDTVKIAFLGPIGLVLASLGALLAWRAPLAWWLAALLGTAGALLPLATGSDWMHGGRLVMPYVPLLAAAIACSWGRLAAKLVRRDGVVSVLLVVVVPLAFTRNQPEQDALSLSARLEAEGARSGHGALASWLQAHAKPGDAIVLMDIGEVGYHCIEQRILDVTGLTDRHIAKSPGKFLAKSFDLAYVFDRRPEFIVLTFVGRGETLAPVDARSPIRPFSEMEERLIEHPAFARDYYRAPTAPAPATGGLEGIRRFFGAEAVFPYATTGQRYLLVVYRRHA